MGADDVIEAKAGDDLQYLQQRAEEELEAAQRSTVPEVTAAHYQLAEAYLEQIDAKREGGEPARRRAGEAGRPCMGQAR